MEKEKAMIHSKNTIETVRIIKKTGDNQYLVETEEGVKCTAIFNFFNGLFYADDKYGIVK